MLLNGVAVITDSYMLDLRATLLRWSETQLCATEIVKGDLPFHLVFIVSGSRR